MPMTAEEKFEYWLDVAQYDLDTAKAMLTSGRWLAVAFMCQQAVEKLVKGLYLLYIDDDVPKINDIPKLVKCFETKLPAAIPENYLSHFAELSAHYLNQCYPEYKTKLASQVEKIKAEELMALTEEVFAWLLTMKP
jgi:HEPN domain-containing protein